MRRTRAAGTQPGDDTTHPWRLGHHSGQPLAAFPSQDDATRAAYKVADYVTSCSKIHR